MLERKSYLHSVSNEASRIFRDYDSYQGFEPLLVEMVIQLRAIRKELRDINKRLKTKKSRYVKQDKFLVKLKAVE